MVLPQANETHANRRSRLIERMPDRSAALFLSLPPSPRNGDVVYPYRPDSDLWYLTGFAEPRCALLVTRGLDAPASVLFLQDRNPDQELWTGPRIGVEDAPDQLGVDAAHDIQDLTQELTSLLRPAQVLIYRNAHETDESRAVGRALQAVRGGPRGPDKGPHSVMDPSLTLHELRMLKDPEEVEAIARANRITNEGLRQVMATTRADTGEWEIQAILEAAFRKRGGWGWAYPTIVASGANACVLHYDANARACGEDDLVLIDAGAEVDGYGADISHTFPVRGKFSAPQRDLYEAVLHAQLAVIEAVRPGQTLDGLHELALRKLSTSMVDLGLVEGPADRVLEDKLFRRYYPHQTSHWLGLDVHDVGAYYLDGKPRALEAGMVFTVEPGLYVPASDTRAPAEMRGIGVRIEDDILVTDEGSRNLTAGVPRSVVEIEEACAN